MDAVAVEIDRRAVSADGSGRGERVRGSERRFAGWIAAGFFVIVALAMSRHEMWRDELEAFLAARDSDTPAEVIRNTRYNGHPITWYLLLHAVTRITHDPRGMQLLHACIATIGAYLVARYAPFSRWQRALLCFGYFPLFEYGVISREYVLGWVALVGFCAAYGAGAGAGVIVLALLAGLLAQTSAYGLMLSMALVATVAIARWFPRSMGFPPMDGRDGHAALLAIVIYVVAVGLAIVQLIPPADSGTVVGWTFDNPLRLFPVSIVWRALVPIPPIDPQFWNENIAGSNKIVGPLALLLFPAVLWMLRRHRLGLLLFALGSIGLMMFGFIKFYGSIRHHGHVFLVLIAAVWMAGSHGRLSDHAAGLGKGLSRALTALLVVHVVAGAIAVSIDWVRPFSQSKAAARFIRDEGLADAFIVGERDTAAASIAAYLGRKIYFPRGDRMGSFIVYDRKRLDFDPETLLDVCQAKSNELERDVLLVSTSPIARRDASTVTPLAQFTGSIVGDEDFWLYRIAPNRPPTPATNPPTTSAPTSAPNPAR